MIQPSVGRIVHFYLWNGGTRSHEGPLAAMVAAVHSATMVNLLVVSANGVPYAQTSVLVQPGQAPPEAGNYCRWMDYQVAQAQLTAQGRQASGGG